MAKLAGFIFLAGIFFHVPAAKADQYHYLNILVGERAMGLGGAFTAVADDASGVVYNPAGIAFALSNDISGSANAFYRRKVVYKKALGDKDFVENSGGSTAPFFGGLQKLDNYVEGASFAFGIYNLDSELKDQNDIIENQSALGLQRFHRTTNIRASTTGFAGALAKRIGNNFALGFGLAFITVDELMQEYQDVNYTSGRFLTQNSRILLGAQAIEPSIGFQWTVGSWAFGANARYRSILSSSYESDIDLSQNFDSNGSVRNPIKIQRSIVQTEAMKTMPAVGRIGMAWFYSTRLLWTADVIHYTAAEGDVFDREAVTNFASGLEYYITPSVPMRVGLFTNYDARPELEEGKLGQAEHIDYNGASLFFALVQPNSQVALGAIYQLGAGKAQKTSNVAIQDVEAESMTVAFSATHSF